MTGAISFGLYAIYEATKVKDGLGVLYFPFAFILSCFWFILPLIIIWYKNDTGQWIWEKGK